ncbi:hypothetical protein [Paracoccus aminovorans]|nr:hypothetical protein [Paracoccus aminovorans]
MASIEKRTVSLPAEHTAFIDDLVASGICARTSGRACASSASSGA